MIRLPVSLVFSFIITGLCLGLVSGECASDQDCDHASTCVNHVCADPCAYISCTPDRKCTTRNHKAECLLKTAPNSTTPTTAPPAMNCRYHSDCGAEQRCVDSLCKVVCPGACRADLNWQCTVVEHVPYCSCRQGYRQEGGEMLTCKPFKPVTSHRSSLVCTTDKDCETDRICRDSKCVDPCAIYGCKNGTVCYTLKHVALCVAVRPALGHDPGVKSFYISDKMVGWARAHNLCWEMGMRLASISNEAEFNKLKKTLEPRGEWGVWIIGLKLYPETTYYWADSGSRFYYSAWYGDRPEDDKHPCVTVTHRDKFRQWYNLECEQERHFACEYYE